MQPTDPEEFFDATKNEPKKDKAPQQQTATDIDKSQLIAEHQTSVAKTIVDDIISQRKKSFRRVVVMSISSVIILLILAIMFFIYFHWYFIGTGVAVLTFVVAQIWLSFFKKWGYNSQNPDNDNYWLDDENSQDLEDSYTKTSEEHNLTADIEKSSDTTAELDNNRAGN